MARLEELLTLCWLPTTILVAALLTGHLPPDSSNLRDPVVVGSLGTSSLVLGRDVITMVGCLRRETGEVEEEGDVNGLRGARRCSGSCFTARPGSVLICRRESGGPEAGHGDTGSTLTSLGFTMRVAGKSVSMSTNIRSSQWNYRKLITVWPHFHLDMNNLWSKVTAAILFIKHQEHTHTQLLLSGFNC